MQKGEEEVYYFDRECGYDPKQIIEAMLRGIDIVLVDPALFPSIRRLLPDYLSEARDQGDRDIATALESYIEYIEGEPQRQAAAKLCDRPPPEVIVIPPVLSQDEVDAEVHTIWETGRIRNFTEPEVLLVVAEMRQRRAEYIAQGNYLDAEKAGRFAKVLVCHGEFGVVEHIQDEKAMYLRFKLDDSRRELEATKGKWEMLYECMRDEAKKEMEKMKEDHKHEIETLERQKHEEPPMQARKYSAGLLQLRRREKALVQNRQFAKACQLKEIADETQRQEDAYIRTKWSNALDLKIANARRGQIRQVKIRKAHWRKEELSLVNDAGKDVEAAEKAIVHLERSLKVAEEAKGIATELRKDAQRPQTSLTALPRLETTNRVQQQSDFRQRQILNKKIYTRLPSGQNSSRASPTKRTRD